MKDTAQEVLFPEWALTGDVELVGGSRCPGAKLATGHLQDPPSPRYGRVVINYPGLGAESHRALFLDQVGARCGFMGADAWVQVIIQRLKLLLESSGGALSPARRKRW